MNDTPTIKTDICVIGGGSGGLSLAAGAVQMGAKVVLVERGRMGGDCLNYGCVPSKALLAAARLAASRKKGDPFGIAPVEASVDFPKVHAHVKDVIAGIAPHDSVERFEGLGVRVIQAEGRFLAPGLLRAGSEVIQAKRFVIATGSSPAVPPVPGLDTVPFFTNETIFDNEKPLPSLIVIGGGPIGLEMAQAHHRLGTKVVVLEAFRALGRDDPEIAKIALDALRAEGLDIREGVKIARVEKDGEGIAVLFEGGERLQGSHLLVATGRKPNIEDLNLNAANVAHDGRAIRVDARLRTSNRRIFAIGDVTGGLQFTHVAGYHAGIVIRNVLFRLPAKARTHHLPWVTYIAPEMAQVGLTEAQARTAHGASLRVLRWNMEDNDRARAERATLGMVKVMVTGRGGILGVSIVGENAGELIQPWALALSSGLKIGAMAGFVSPYPTFGEVNKRAAGSFYTGKLFSSRTRAVVRFLLSLG